MEMLRLTGNLAVKTFGIGLVVAGLIISATMLFEHNEVQTAGPAIQESIDNYIDKTEITLQKEKINTVYLPLTEENYTDIIDAGGTE